ncbi:DUF4139 domain-containing protein [Paraliomyxa miuraensis]|uniref:DUF4139 domain-containing protein n=1 Tax=Paraliomyxa miuraensis TaxID=376150 RepID=UPI00224E6165|nr:DUF4139 domain-containing protein [Paraliomyxa miuraensis]MCX4240428.1 DUF4139 domain-containing protein [Paraliomyxa miuraensis]
MRSLRFALLALPLLSSLACATAPRERALPLAKLRLYETGVGYYERAGELGGPGGASLPVPSGHLDDALKSLVVLGEDGTVRSVAFDSRQSPAVARARAGLPPETSAPIRVHDVLLGLRGHEVVVRHKAKRIRGRVVDVIGVPDVTFLENGDNGTGTGEDVRPTTAEQAGATKNKTFALLVTRTGRYRRVDVAGIDEVTPVDPDVRNRMQAALDATVALRSNARGLLDMEGEGKAVRVGYLAESPVWRASYRLVLDDAHENAALQGWALVHNDTEEDWDDIALELVNGRPDSFLFPLAAPRYERRDLVVPDRELSSVPQLLDTTPDAMWGDFLDGEEGYGGGGSGYGYGSGSGFGARGRRVPTARTTSGAVTGSSDLVSVGNLAELATGAGRETKTVFVYGAAEPIDLAAGRSAMVPFVQSRVDSAAITWMLDFREAPARHAVRVNNSTSQTLPEGTLGVYGDGGFSGETVLPRLKPGERRFLEIGDDPDTEITRVERDVVDTPQRLVYRGDRLQEHVLRRSTVTFDLINRSGQARHVHVEVPAGSNTKIEGTDRVDFDLDRGRPLAIFEVGPAAELKDRTVVIEEGIQTAVDFEGLTENRLERLAKAPSLTEDERGVMKTSLERLREQHVARAEVDRIKAEIAVIEADIERLRGHLTAMGGEGTGEKNPVVERLLATEDQLQARRKELETATKALDGRIEATRESLLVLAPER